MEAYILKHKEGHPKFNITSQNVPEYTEYSVRNKNFYEDNEAYIPLPPRI